MYFIEKTLRPIHFEPQTLTLPPQAYNQYTVRVVYYIHPGDIIKV